MVYRCVVLILGIYHKQKGSNGGLREQIGSRYDPCFERSLGRYSSAVSGVDVDLYHQQRDYGHTIGYDIGEYYRGRCRQVSGYNIGDYHNDRWDKHDGGQNSPRAGLVLTFGTHHKLMGDNDEADVSKIVAWQVGLLGIRVGEASHPGPGAAAATKRRRDGKRQAKTPTPDDSGLSGLLLAQLKPMLQDIIQKLIREAVADFFGKSDDAVQNGTRPSKTKDDPQGKSGNTKTSRETTAAPGPGRGTRQQQEPSATPRPQRPGMGPLPGRWPRLRRNLRSPQRATGGRSRTTRRTLLTLAGRTPTPRYS